MNFNEAQKLANDLLDKVQVASVYYIDDYLSYDGLQLITKYIDDASEDMLKQLGNIIPEEVKVAKTAGVDVISIVESWWGEQNPSEQQKVLKSCKLDKKSQPESRILKILDGKCISCSPEEWISDKSNECLEKISHGEKVLLLFDQMLGENDSSMGEGRSGVSLAQSFAGNEGVINNSYCGIFSNKFDVSEEFDFRKDNRDALFSWAFPFSKRRLPSDDDYTLFLEGLNNLLWVGYVDSLSSVAQNLIENTARKLQEAFQDIMPLDFRQMVVKSSVVEGCREMDTLLRLIHIIFDRELQSALVEMPNGILQINENVDGIKSVDAITGKKLQTQYDINAVKGFFRDEIFVPGDTVNRLLMPLQNGDVFCVSDNKYYVLLCQPCNISLREGGKRSGPKDNPYDTGYFVPLIESDVESILKKHLTKLFNIEEANREKKIEDFMGKVNEQLQEASQGSKYKVKCDIEGKRRYASVNKYVPISLALLDYCTFSADGQAIINKEISPLLHENQKLLCENHAKRFQKHMDLESLLEGISKECHATIKPKIENWFYSLLTKLGITSKFENNQYVFPIKRIGHLQDPLASDLLIQLSHYISRTGLPNEFD